MASRYRDVPASRDAMDAPGVAGTARAAVALRRKYHPSPSEPSPALVVRIRSPEAAALCAALVEASRVAGSHPVTVAQQMPALAAAFQQRMGEVHITAVDGANPFGYIAAAVEGVMGLARAAGLEVPSARVQKAELTEESGLDSGRR
ncbi:hypothetical protein WMF21_25195 [Sorangium sp. So ce1099]